MRVVFFLICFGFLSSCASIHVEVDIYDGNILEERDVNAIVLELQNVKPRMIDFVSDKQMKFSDFYELYLNIQKIINKDEFNRSDLDEIFLPPKQEYFEVTQKKVDQLTRLIDSSIVEIRRSGALMNLSGINAIENAINIKIEEVTNPPIKDNLFFEFIISDWQKRVEEFNVNNILQLTGNEIDSSELSNIKQLMREQLHLIAKINLPISINLTSLLTEIESANDNDDLIQLMDKEKNILKKIKSSTSEINSIRKITLLQNIYAQNEDYGDPIWSKIITQNPQTKKNWKSIYGKTKFKATGRSSVIIVRDNPVDFRIKQGENDPKALIQGQLIVSRSLVDLGLAIAGFSNANVESKSSENIESTVESVPDDPVNENLELLKKENDFFDKMIESFDQSLKDIQEELIIENDPEKIQHIKDRLEVQLEMYKLLFENLKTKEHGTE